MERKAQKEKKNFEFVRIEPKKELNEKAHCFHCHSKINIDIERDGWTFMLDAAAVYVSVAVDVKPKMRSSIIFF